MNVYLKQNRSPNPEGKQHPPPDPSKDNLHKDNLHNNNTTQQCDIALAHEVETDLKSAQMRTFLIIIQIPKRSTMGYDN